MTDAALHLGPWAVSASVLVAVAALLLGGALGVRLARSAGADARLLLLHVALVGLFAARLAFVWQWRGAYLEHPLSILDLRDGGWSAESGIAAAALFGFYRIRHAQVLRRPLIAALLTASGVLAIGSVALLASPAEGTLPEIELPALDGAGVALTGFTGKPTVLNLWASWCGPCRREMPLLQEAQETTPGVHFVFVNQGEAAEIVAAYLLAHRLSLRNVLLDTRLQTGAAFNQRALPTTLFFDARGRLVGTRIGELSAATLAERIGVAQRPPAR